MKAGGSKAKGSSFERKICRDLSLWITYGQTEDVFWRSAMSGGRSTMAAKSGKRLQANAGDISAVSKIGHNLTRHFLLECKAYRDLNLDCFIKGNGKLIEFWRHLVKESEKYERLPMLIAKQNNHPIFMCLSTAGSRKLMLPSRLVTTIIPREDMKIVLFGNFMVSVDPKVLKREEI